MCKIACFYLQEVIILRYSFKKSFVYFILCVLLVFIATGFYRNTSASINTNTDPNVDQAETVTQVQEVKEYNELPTKPVIEHETEAPVIKLKNVPLLYSEVNYSTPITRSEAVVQLEAITELIECLKVECTSDIYTVSAITDMEYEVNRLQDIVLRLQADIDRFLAWETEYPYATGVWYFLRGNGYSEAVTAGIIGNMMIETSGGTLKLNPTIYNSTRTFYGLCQWSLYYRPEVADMSFEEQLDYLDKYMYKEFDTFGFCYKNNFTYDDFLALEDPADAALAFAKVYERCGSDSYSLRQTAAKTAYGYFATELD